ncbi:MAG: helix-turn-helix domain-containing protein [Deltaproteobacteria bacterium]|jgi:AraC-like DNA-binding protein|nr:helix-turn-helix domain-containing protein [Deltaproteobacteria bacterium]
MPVKSSKNYSPLYPQQPGLVSRVESMVSKIYPWNPYSLKNKALIYQFTTGPNCSTVERIPDNCLEFVFEFGPSPKAWLSGSVEELTIESVEPNSTYFIFKPYSLSGSILAKLGHDELRGQRIPLNMLLKDESVIEHLAQARDFESRVSTFIDYLRQNIVDSSRRNYLAEQLQLLICACRGGDRIKNLAKKTGFTPHYCHIKFRDSLGLTLKTYSDVIRFQSVVDMLTNLGVRDFHKVIQENNFFDQAHLIHVFKKYTKISPTNYIRRLSHSSDILKNSLNQPSQLLGAAT